MAVIQPNEKLAALNRFVQVHAIVRSMLGSLTVGRWVGRNKADQDRRSEGSDDCFAVSSFGRHDMKACSSTGRYFVDGIRLRGERVDFERDVTFDA